jgi:glutamate formiminotransferase/glutamate formiminotransferase/formiminotetrahydrofolate cyclodeaminase
MTRLIECVPNFSEGTSRDAIGRIISAIGGVDGVALLGHESDVDHNRSVITFAGEPSAVVEGALNGIEHAVRTIDLRTHAGVHPRIGAADVVPFVPVNGMTLSETAAIAHEVGREIWTRFAVPVYFYEDAALRPEYRRLESIRRGGARGLAPDVGGPEPHPSAGACIVGARNFLIAFNVHLRSADTEAARSIARQIRASSGGLPAVKAIGVPLPSRGIVQVAMNLTDFETTSIYEAFAAVQSAAQERGIEVLSTQLVGLIPRKALEGGSPESLRLEDFGPHRVLEDRIAQTLTVK